MKALDSTTEDFRITVDEGKYTVIFMRDGRLRALRYKEEWRDCTGDKLILALACEIEALRKQLSIT